MKKALGVKHRVGKMVKRDAQARERSPNWISVVLDVVQEQDLPSLLEFALSREVIGRL